MGSLPPESFTLQPMTSSLSFAATLGPLVLLAVAAVIVTLCVLIAGLISERRFVAFIFGANEPQHTTADAPPSIRSAA